MKSFFSISTFVSLLLLSQVSCFAQKKIKGNGKMITKTIVTQEYDAVKVVGFMDVLLESGTEGNITVSTDENLYKYLIIEVNLNKLTIRIKKGIHLITKKGIVIIVPVQEINEVSLVGSGDVISKDVIASQDVSISLIGSGDIDLPVRASQTDVKIVGSGDVKLSGATGNLEVKLSGSGDFNGYSLLSQDTEAYVSGSGDVKVSALKSLKARVNGSGDIAYKGNPEILSTKIIGSGDITGH